MGVVVMDQILYQKLINLREEIKKENKKLKKKNNTMMNAVVSEKVLESIATLKPNNVEAFKIIRGIGDSFVEQYGERFLSVIHEHMNTSQKQAKPNTKEVEILNKLSNKLVNINKKNRLLYNGRLSKKYAFDLMRLDDKKVTRIIQSFINEDEQKQHVIAKVNYDKGRRSKASEDFEALKTLYRNVETIKVEKGQEVLYLGYPYVEGRLFYEDFQIKAPLFLFPAKLEVINNEYRLSFDKNRDIVYNTTLILANNKFNNKNEVIPDNVIENIDKDTFIQDAIRYFEKHHIKIKDEEVNFEEFNESILRSNNYDEEFNLHLKGYCVLGSFPMFSNSIQKDYNQIIERESISPLVRNLFTGIDRISDSEITYTQQIFNKNEEDVVDEVNLHYINTLNYSQEKVLSEIDKKDAIVIQGPPGTGKSQTITSLIAQAVLQNKKVLVVSEKKTALDVIYNRLGKIANFVLYIDDPNNKEVFYEHLMALLEFDDEVNLTDHEIKKIAIQINYELGKLNELEALLDTKTSLNASLRELYQNSRKIDLKDQQINSLYKEVQSKKSTYYLAELLSLKQTFEDHDLTEALINHKKYLPYEEIYALLKEDIKDTELQFSQNELLEINFFMNLYQKFGWFIKWRLRQKSKSLIKKVKDIALQLSGKQKKKMKKMIYQESDLFIQSVVNYPSYQYSRKIYNSLTKIEREYFEKCYALSKKLSLDFEYVNVNLIHIYTTSVIEQYESNHDDILGNTVRFQDIREKIEQLSLEKEKLTFDLLFNYLQHQIATTFNLHSKRLQELKRRCESKRKWSIQKLISQFQIELLHAIQVWLLTPEGVSEILPLEENQFDLIIFDEASQMFIENAIPILYRGKKAVVAGDSKQLRPSKFAVGRIDTEDLDYDAYSGVLEEESLLDLAKHRYHEVMLNYHYRSKYEELIAFSNYAFYAGNLHVGPNISSKGFKPIERIKVNGKWIDRKNEIEADEVITLLKKIFRKRTNETIGIITFNATQKDLIQDKIEEACLNNEKFNQVILNERLKHPNEQLFIKNIENVQGDERDIIIFSIGYAPNEYDRIVRQFGWLNNEGGENRLNVAISRAKQKIYVITSIEPHELHVEDMKNNGPKLLRQYLEYVKAVSENDRLTAERILLGLNGEVPMEQLMLSTSQIQEDLYQELINIGITVEKNVGIGSNKIDLAIKDSITKQYILGIELDTLHYTDLNSTKERDYHRQKYLETFGWEIHRVWCSDYWRNKEKEINRIVKLINQYAMAS
jgi:superfamily I DNA and/or RNA helicase/very-short-patch-repair endonuclease